jgi:succinyl-diaminopimelate desuccinylase
VETTLSDALALAQALIRRPSVSPDDGGCQELLIERLLELGFEVERLPFGDVSNFWARLGTAAPLVVFAGHTDVVPPGPLEDWRTPPFEPVVRDGRLWGRGASDMKSSLAAMIVATERLLHDGTPIAGSIGFLVTSDEEAEAVNGTVKVIETLSGRGVRIDHCIVGEPSSTSRTGDVVRNGRRGSLNGYVRVRGVQGHVAYPEQVVNPIHRFAPALVELAAQVWDRGTEYFPPTSLQFSNIRAGTGATNVVPGELEAWFNFRFSPQQTPDALRGAVETCLARHGLDFSIDWRLSGMPFITPRGALTDAVEEVVAAVMGQRPALSTSGGTSDGRFIAPTGAGVVELGPANATIHQANEHIVVAQIEELTCIYHKLLQRLLAADR